MRGPSLRELAIQNVPLRTEMARAVRDILHPPPPECENMRIVREVNEDPLPGRVMQMIDFSAIELRIAADLGLTAEAFLRK
jgi:DNA polymerase I-like protein with 3'-5' exonuclease and polymerase domains